MTAQDRDRKSKRGLPKDVPSETARTGLPQSGDGADAASYLRDVVPKPGETYDPRGADAPSEGVQPREPEDDDAKDQADAKKGK